LVWAAVSVYLYFPPLSFEAFFVILNVVKFRPWSPTGAGVNAVSSRKKSVRSPADFHLIVAWPGCGPGAVVSPVIGLGYLPARRARSAPAAYDDGSAASADAGVPTATGERPASRRKRQVPTTRTTRTP
jgi:hypothetical protein